MNKLHKQMLEPTYQRNWNTFRQNQDLDRYQCSPKNRAETNHKIQFNRDVLKR